MPSEGERVEVHRWWRRGRVSRSRSGTIRCSEGKSWSGATRVPEFARGEDLQRMRVAGFGPSGAVQRLRAPVEGFFRQRLSACLRWRCPRSRSPDRRASAGHRLALRSRHAAVCRRGRPSAGRRSRDHLVTHPDGRRLVYGRAVGFRSLCVRRRLVPRNCRRRRGPIRIRAPVLAGRSIRPHRNVRSAAWRRRPGRFQPCLRGVGVVGDAVDRARARSRVP